MLQYLSDAICSQQQQQELRGVLESQAKISSTCASLTLPAGHLSMAPGHSQALGGAGW